MNQRPLILSELTTDEFSSLRPDIDLVLMPSGSIRHHQAESPLGTDTLTAERFCHIASEYFFPNLLVAPPIYWSILDPKLPESKQLCIDSNTTTSIISDVISSLQTHGLNNHLIINNHPISDQLLNDVSKGLTQTIPGLTVRNIALPELGLSHRISNGLNMMAENPKSHKQRQQQAIQETISLDDIETEDNALTDENWLSAALERLKDVIEVTYT
tara:strand:+ start:2263 stop:2907 length:645 start_codon:yes stop_codon:yes gene_type:complete